MRASEGEGERTARRGARAPAAGPRRFGSFSWGQEVYARGEPGLSACGQLFLKFGAGDITRARLVRATSRASLRARDVGTSPSGATTHGSARAREAVPRPN